MRLQNIKQQSIKTSANTLINQLTDLLHHEKILQRLKKEELILRILPIEEIKNEPKITDNQKMKKHKKKIEIQRIQRYHTISNRSKNLKNLNFTDFQKAFKDQKLLVEKIRKSVEFSGSSLDNFIFNGQQQLKQTRFTQQPLTIFLL